MRWRPKAWLCWVGHTLRIDTCLPFLVFPLVVGPSHLVELDYYLGEPGAWTAAWDDATLALWSDIYPLRRAVVAKPLPLSFSFLPFRDPSV